MRSTANVADPARNVGRELAQKHPRLFSKLAYYLAGAASNFNSLGCQVGNHRIQYRKAGQGDPEPAFAGGFDQPVAAQIGDPDRVELSSGQFLVTPDLDSFGKPQSHQQELVAPFFAGQFVVGNQPVAVRLNARQPGFRTLFGRGCMALTVDVEPPVSTRPDAGIFLPAPVNQLVPALGAGPRMIGNLIGRQSVRSADFQRRVVERAGEIVVGRLQLAGLMQRGIRRVGFDGKLLA